VLANLLWLPYAYQYVTEVKKFSPSLTIYDLNLFLKISYVLSKISFFFSPAIVGILFGRQKSTPEYDPWGRHRYFGMDLGGDTFFV